MIWKITSTLCFLLPSVSAGFNENFFSSESAQYGSCTNLNSTSPGYLNLFSYLAMNEAAGATNLSDTSSNGNAATITNATTGSTGRVGNGLLFTQSPLTDGFISTANTITDPQTFSISTWFKTSAITGGILIQFAAGSSYDRMIYMLNNGQISFGIYTGSTAVITSPGSYNDGNWHQVVGTYTANSLILYIDNTVVASRTSGVAAAQNYNGNWKMGGGNINGWSSSAGDGYFTGILDEVAIWSTVLSPSDVSTIFSLGSAMTSTNTPQWANLIGLWHLDESSGPFLDSSGHSNSGTGQAVVYGATGKYGNGVSFFGLVNSNAVITTVVSNPTAFSLSAWFKTSFSGGQLIGFSDSTGSANFQNSSRDRMIYFSSSGQLVFGIYDGSTTTITTPGSYSDGKWHQVVGTYSSGSMILYLDGSPVMQSTSVGVAQNYSGYWRVGGGTSEWPGNTNSVFLGTIDEVAIFNVVLTHQQVRALYDQQACSSN